MVLSLVTAALLTGCSVNKLLTGQSRFASRSFRLIGDTALTATRAAQSAHLQFAEDQLRERWSMFNLVNPYSPAALRLSPGLYWSRCTPLPSYNQGFMTFDTQPVDSTTLAVNGGEAQCQFTPINLPPDLSEVSLTGTFDAEAVDAIIAQLALKSPSTLGVVQRSTETFREHWTVTGRDNGTSFSEEYYQVYYVERVYYPGPQ